MNRLQRKNTVISSVHNIFNPKAPLTPKKNKNEWALAWFLRNRFERTGAKLHNNDWFCIRMSLSWLNNVLSWTSAVEFNPIFAFYQELLTVFLHCCQKNKFSLVKYTKTEWYREWEACEHKESQEESQVNLELECFFLSFSEIIVTGNGRRLNAK